MPESELDKWSPRPKEETHTQEKPAPEDGVLEGVERPRQKRYARRWYQIRREGENDET